MPASSMVKNLNDGVISFADGTGTPLAFTVIAGAGDFSYSAIKTRLSATTVYQSRGVLCSVRHTEREFPTISFSGLFINFDGNTKTATTGSMHEVVMKDGATFGAAVSTLGTNADVYTLDVTLTIEGTDFGDSGDHTVTFHDVELTIEGSEGDPDTWACNGVVYGEIDGDIETTNPT